MQRKQELCKFDNIIIRIPSIFVFALEFHEYEWKYIVNLTLRNTKGIYK